MKYVIENAELNYFYDDCIKVIIKNAKSNPSSRYAEFLEKIFVEGKDLYQIPYLKKYDETEIVELDKKYQLLPITFLNCNVLGCYVRKEVNKASGSFRLRSFYDMFFSDPDFQLRHYKNLSNEENSELKRIADSYIKHYAESLDEHWSYEDFYKMFDELKYKTLKYAMDVETKEVFVVGFFGASVRQGAGGGALTNAELYVMPEFRKMGIAKKLVGITFERAQEDGIDNFDSITYKIPGNDSLGFWKSVGAKVSGLTYIEGDVSEILDTIEEKSVNEMKF